MKKLSAILVFVAVLASCERDYENHYTVRRLSVFEESNVDGTSKRVDTYTYHDDGYSVESTLDGEVTSVVRHRDVGDSLVVTTSVGSEGSLVLFSTAVTTYVNEYRANISAVKTIYADGSPIRLESYVYEGSVCTITVTVGGMPVSMREVSDINNGTSISTYDYDPGAGEWVYSGREDVVYSDFLRTNLTSRNTYDAEDVLVSSELYSYDNETTTVITYEKNIPTLKSVYVSTGPRIVFQRYKSEGGPWVATSVGSYLYEYVTI